MALGGRAVGEVDHVRAVRAGAGPCRDVARTPSRTSTPSLAQRLADHRGVARVVGRREPVARLDDRHRHAEPRVGLGELAAGRAAAEDERGSSAARGRASPRGSSRRRSASSPGIGGTFDDRADRDDDVRGRRVDASRRRAGPRPTPRSGDRGRRRDRRPRPPPRAPRRARRRPAPRRPAARLIIQSRRVGGLRATTTRAGFAWWRAAPIEQRLRRQAADVRAAAAEPAPVDDRDARAPAGAPRTRPIRRPGRRR